jgi:long-chain acyl-CoA synthetase
MNQNRSDPNFQVIPSDAGGTLPGLFARRVSETPDAPAYSMRPEEASEWQSVTWRETAALVGRWRQGLAGEDLRPGDRVAVLLPNCLEWVCFEQAALSLGLVVVPLYNWDSLGNIAYILRDSGARLLLVETAERALELGPEIADQGNTAPQILYLGLRTDEMETPVAEWLPDEGAETANLREDPDAPATIIYTSGTTGRPKGVMLSHRNILSNAEAVLSVVPPLPGDRFLSILPLAHAFERTVGYYVPMMAGLTVAFARSPKTIREDLPAVNPTVMLVVPRLLEQVYGGIQKQLTAKSAIARWLFELTLAIGWRRFLEEQGRGQMPLFGKLLWPVLHKLVIGPTMAALGGRIRMMVSGGAPLRPEICRFFLSLGIPVLQGYGLSEAAPVVATNLLGNNLPETVGPPLPGVEVQLGADGELLVRSPGVMLGYWNRPEETRAVIDPEGWLHSGDRGEISNGRITVLGRMGELMILSTGHKVPANAVETALLEDPIFAQIIVIAGDRPHSSALAVLDPEEWTKLAKGLGLDPDDRYSLGDGRVQETLRHKAADRLADFPPYCCPQRFGLSLEPWTIEHGLLTPTLKAKRAKVMEYYADIVESLYRSDEGEDQDDNV